MIFKLVIINNIYVLKCLFVDAVRLNPLTKQSSNAEVEYVIKDWLRLAKDRDGGRRKRERSRTNVGESSSTPELVHETNIGADDSDEFADTE